MGLRETLEEVHSLLINNEVDKAEKRFHEAFVEAAKNIHSKLMEEDNSWLDEMEDEGEFDVDEAEDDIEGMETGSQEYVTDDDFAGDEDEAEGDLEAELDPSEFEDGEGEFDDEESEGGSIEGIIDDLEADIERLKAEYETLQGTGDDESDFEDDEFPEDGEDDEFEDDEFPEDGEEEDFPEDDGEEDEFDSLEEAFELEKVSADNDWGKTTERQIGSRDSNLTVNKTSPLPKSQGKVENSHVHNPNAKGKNHSGYARESAPAVDTVKKRKNNVSPSDENYHQKGGNYGANHDGSALLNKDHGGKKEGESPISGKMKTKPSVKKS